MVRQPFLGHLYIHLGSMLLKTEVRMLLKPPRGYLTLADTAKDRWRWWMELRIINSRLC